MDAAGRRSHFGVDEMGAKSRGDEEWQVATNRREKECVEVLVGAGVVGLQKKHTFGV